MEFDKALKLVETWDSQQDELSDVENGKLLLLIERFKRDKTFREFIWIAGTFYVASVDNYYENGEDMKEFNMLKLFSNLMTNYILSERGESV